jgi:hypothetical protein
LLNDPSRSPAYIAGVTNPIFEATGSWDVLFDIGTSRIIISKDINANCPPSATGGPATASGNVSTVSSIARSGPLKAEPSLGSEDDVGRVGKDATQPSKNEFVAKADSPDNLFIEDVSGSCESDIIYLLRRLTCADRDRDLVSLW